MTIVSEFWLQPVYPTIETDSYILFQWDFNSAAAIQGEISFGRIDDAVTIRVLIEVEMHAANSTCHIRNDSTAHQIGRNVSMENPCIRLDQCARGCAAI